MSGEDRAAALGAALLSWYDRQARDLPWRRRRDAYAIWVSEVMLQQTRVDTVARYYEDFLRRFPDVAALAAAREEEVLAAWSGLGYYRRARHLHAAARAVVAAGAMPRGAAAWRQLPGIGEYTAAAIASIADGEVVPVLDGNVERVVSRLLASGDDPKKAATRRRLAAAARRLLDGERPGDSNQALMEIGATICSPLQPGCGGCPLRPGCAAAASGRAEVFPPPRRRRPMTHVNRQVFVVELEQRILLIRRSPEERLLAGFWELPWVECRGRGRLAASLTAKYGGGWIVGEHLGRVAHSITRRRFAVDVYSGQWQPEGPGEGGSPGWYRRAEIDDLATSSLVVKALDRWTGGSTPAR